MTTDNLISQQISTPLGEVTLATTTQGICLLAFSQQSQSLNKAIADLERRLNTVAVTGNHPYLDQAVTELAAYFAGEQQSFTVPLHPLGTAFQQRVWQSLLTIPYGQTICYSQQAQSLHQPTAVRAVARANGANKISILIPCHRVIGKNHQLTGYAGGLERKQQLLNLESAPGSLFKKVSF